MSTQTDFKVMKLDKIAMSKREWIDSWGTQRFRVWVVEGQEGEKEQPMRQEEKGKKEERESDGKEKVKMCPGS